MTALEMYDFTTHGGSTHFATLIRACESLGPYCLIGCMAVNCYVEPVYSLDVQLVVGHQPSVNALAAGSDLRIQFTTDERNQYFLPRSVEADVLGMKVKIACLEDVTQGKLWAFGDPQPRLSKRKKDELDLIRLAEAYPRLKAMLPSQLLEQF